MKGKRENKGDRKGGREDRGKKGRKRNYTIFSK